MKSSISIGQISDGIVYFIRRFHVLIYTLTVVIGVAVAVFQLNGLITEQSPTDSGGGTAASSFDKDTIDRINNFNTASSDEDTFSLPPGRINPLVD